MNGKIFPLSSILSVTTKILCSNDIDDLYAILNYMTGDNLYTHDLPRAGNECRPYLYEQLPFLREITTDDVRGNGCLSKVAALATTFGAQHTVYPIHQEDHQQLSPDDVLR